MEQDLKEQVAVVTGAGHGIGRAIASGYAAAGASVVLAARSSDEIEAAAIAIREAGGTAMAVITDVRDEAQVEALFDAAVAAYGGIDIAVVNAGIGGGHRRVVDDEPARWREIIDTNLIGAMIQCRAAVPHLKARGGGKIILMGSGLGRNAIAGRGAYGCSKAAVALLTRVLAAELRDTSIAVNEISPGPVRTVMTGVPEETAAADDGNGLMTQVPEEWLKDPRDVVPLALFLASLPNDGPSGQRYALNRRDIGA